MHSPLPWHPAYEDGSAGSAARCIIASPRYPAYVLIVLPGPRLDAFTLAVAPGLRTDRAWGECREAYNMINDW